MRRPKVMTRTGALALMSAAVFAVGCGQSESAQEEDESSSAAEGGAQTLELGMVDSLTGLTAASGTSNACGALIAVDAINAGDTDGTDGVTVDLSLEDDQSTPAVAARSASALTAEGIKLFVGGSNSATVLATMPIVDDAGGMHTGGTSKSEEFLTAGELVARINSDTAQDGAATADFINGLDPQTVHFVVARGVFGEGAVATVESNLDEGIERETTFVSETGTNFDSVITDLTRSRPDVVAFIFGTTGQQVAFMRDVAGADLDAEIVAYPGNLGGAHVAQAGGATDGVLTLDIYAPVLENPANDTLKQAFETYGSEHGECRDKTVDRQLALSYSQVLLMAQAASEAGTTDPAELHEAILAGTWSLPQGDVTFESNGQVSSEHTVLVGEGGDIVEYEQAG